MTLQFVAVAEGVAAKVGKREMAVLGALPDFLASLADADDPARERLRPSPYDDEAADREFHRLAGTEIERGRRSDLEALGRSLEQLERGSAVLTVDDAEGLVRAVGTARIAIAARNGMLASELPRRPRTAQESIVVFLGMVQEELVHALSASFPEEP